MGVSRWSSIGLALLACTACHLPQTTGRATAQVDEVERGDDDERDEVRLRSDADEDRGGLSAGLIDATFEVLGGVADAVTRSVGVEYQAYPAGHLIGLHAQSPISDRSALTYRLAKNITDRRDWGEQDDEQGSGWGGGIGLRSYLGPDRQGWWWGARADLWSLEIDWTDDPGGPSEQAGSTDILVLQPTAEFGYGLRTGSWRWEFGLGLGFEINLVENGREVGEGAIALLGVTLLFHPR